VVPIQVSDGGRQLGRTLQARDQSTYGAVAEDQWSARVVVLSTVAQVAAFSGHGLGASLAVAEFYGCGRSRNMRGFLGAQRVR
jgi:hypothetical protein